jgi:hypothetical protein
MTEPVEINIVKVRGDTKRHIFVLSNSETEEILNVSGWTEMEMVVNSEKSPTDDTNEQERMTGIFSTDGADGEIGFIPSGTLPIGKYYYDIQVIDDNGEKYTPIKGSYKIIQDINKE